jgi:hypothetical protein
MLNNKIKLNWCVVDKCRGGAVNWQLCLFCPKRHNCESFGLYQAEEREKKRRKGNGEAKRT